MEIDAQKITIKDRELKVSVDINGALHKKILPWITSLCTEGQWMSTQYYKKTLRVTTELDGAFPTELGPIRLDGTHVDPREVVFKFDDATANVEILG